MYTFVLFRVDLFIGNSQQKMHRHTMDETPHEGPAAMALTTDNFEATHHKYGVMLVNFFAPWCHWCQRLEPVWEKSAAAVGERHPGHTIVLAKVT